MKKTAFVTALSGAIALTVSACAPEAEAPEAETAVEAEDDAMVPDDASETPVDERTEDCQDPNEDGTCNDDDGGDRSGPGAPTGTDDRREMQQQ